MIEVSKNETESRYEALVDGKVAGFAQYRPIGDAIMFPHTEVDPAYEGQGIGSQIAKFGLDDVRRMGDSQMPLYRGLHP